MSPDSLGQLWGGKNPGLRARIFPSIPAPGQNAGPPGPPKPASGVHGKVEKTPVPARTRQAACPACPVLPYLRRIQPGSRAPWSGPASRLSPTILGPGPPVTVEAPAVWRRLPGPGGGWVDTLGERSPRRLARRASPLTVRPAPPAAAPRGFRAQPMGTGGTDNTPRSESRRPVSLAERSGRVWPRRRRAGAPRSAADKDCASRARPLCAGKGPCGGLAVGTQRTRARNLPTARCEGRCSLGSDPGAPRSVWMQFCCSTSSSLPVSWGRGDEHTWNAAILQGLRAWMQLDVKVQERPSNWRDLRVLGSP